MIHLCTLFFLSVLGHIFQVFYFNVCVCISTCISHYTEMEWAIFYVITNLIFMSLRLLMSFNWKWPFAIMEGAVRSETGRGRLKRVTRHNIVGFSAECQGFFFFFCFSSVNCHNKTNWYDKKMNLLIHASDSGSVLCLWKTCRPVISPPPPVETSLMFMDEVFDHCHFSTAST